MKYLYEGHLGNLFTTLEPLSYEQRYCDTCGDSDWELGSFETINDFWDLVKDECNGYNGNGGGWALQYILPIMVSEFNLDVKLPYENDYFQFEGVCDLTDKEIIDIIENLLKEEKENETKINH